MEIYTNSKNTSTLKLLIAALIAKRKVEIKSATFNDNIFSGPRQLPLLVENGVKLFGNAAVHYLIPSSSPLETGYCQQLLEWEATRLQPAVFTVLNGKVASDLKQLLQSLLQTVDQTVSNGKSVLNNKLSAADISIWSTIYPLYYNGDLKQQYLSEHSNLTRWFEDMASNAHVQEAVKQWDGNAEGPYGATSALGVPQIASLVSPIASPDEGNLTEAVVTPLEIEAAKENWKSAKGKLLPPLKHEGVVLPVKGRKNILVTSALPYVNNVPHLGNIIGCVLSADIFVRYCKICGYNPLYICGTDEYGTATETKALEERVTPRQICDKYYAIHSDVYKWFNIGFDYFGRTSTKEQTEISQQLFLELNKSGFVTAQSVDQLLCEKCDRFLADRFVEGTCPHPGCGYEGARGDQCDKCGKLIVAVELISPRCKVCGHTPVMRPSEQLFIELSQLETSIRTWVSSAEAGWSPSARAVTRAWLREPLRARAVTRDLKWGVPVPMERFKNKVFYVWFDAPIGYMSITQCATQRYEEWWLENKEYNVSLYQFMAKDNVPFHAIMFPATLIGVNKKHILVKHLYATEYLNYEEGKFSKSRGVGVFGTDARDTGIPSDVWRFYLASIRPETSDSSFSWVELGTRNNSELLNNMGNFCHRSLSFCANSFKGKVPELKLTQADYELIALVNREIVAYVQHMEKGRLREALRHVLSISRLGNQHMQFQQPWVLLKGSAEDKERGTTAIGLCCQLVALLCTLISPYMPDTSARLSKQLCLNPDDLRIDPGNPSFMEYLPPGHTIGKPEPLFSKLEPERLEALKAQYAGTQSERADKLNGASKTSSNPSVAELEAAIVEQGNKVRQLKASTKDKTVWQPEVDKLLSLKKQLTSVQQATPAGDTSSDSVAGLEKKIAEQGDKVRKLKSSTKDKSVWQPEVNTLLDLKKRLAALQLK